MVGFALACQPHFLIKSLYVKTDRQVNQYLTVAVVAGVLFNMVLLCGLYARIDGAEFIGRYIAENGLGIDGVMPAYIIHTFEPQIAILISIALLAAGMSTLDGILVALSAILANDVILVLRKDRGTPEENTQLAFKAGRWGLIAMGIAAFVLSVAQHYNKELSVAIFAQEGVYALFAATFVPVLFGIFPVDLPKRVVMTASIGALIIHFGFRYAKLSLLTGADYTNPGLTSTYGLIFSLMVAFGYLAVRRLRS